MAVSQNYDLISVVAGATFSTADVYKFVVFDSSGNAVLPNTTGDVIPQGVLYGRTGTTSAAGSEAVPVAVSGVVKVKMAASTMAAGQPVAASTAGLGIAPTTDAYRAGVVLSGTSGGANRIFTVLLGSGPLNV